MANKKEVTKKANTTKKVAAEKAVSVPVAKKSNVLSAPVYSLAGTAAGDFALPKELFGVKINKALLSQAMRIYFTNERAHWSNTQTRGEVSGTTKKVWKQKGTGRARHGSMKAPIFVGGGIALGPKGRKTVLDLNKKMKKAALISALSQKAFESEVFAVEGMEKAKGKTSEMAKLLGKINRKSVLVITEGESDLVGRAVSNLPKVQALSAKEVNAYEVIKHHSIMLTKKSVDVLLERLMKEETK